MHKSIQNNSTESRRDPIAIEWMLWIACPDSSGMERAASKNSNTAKFQLWQPESHPIQLINNKMAHQKLDYIHYNPLEAVIITKIEEWKYSSAIDLPASRQVTMEVTGFWKS